MLAEDCRIGVEVVVSRMVPGDWVPGMDRTIGMRGTIREVFDDGSGVQVSLPNDVFGWAYPPEALDIAGPRDCTLSPEEVADAHEDGVDTSTIEPGVSHARRGGQWFWTESESAFAAGLYEPKDGVFPVPEKAAAALDHVVNHWARVAEMDKIAAQVAASLKDARALAEKHIAAFAESIDALSIDAAEDKRDTLVFLRSLARDFDRLIRIYEAQADGSKP